MGSRQEGHGRCQEGKKEGTMDGWMDGWMGQNKQTTKLSKAVTFLFIHYKPGSHTETSSMHSNGPRT